MTILEREGEHSWTPPGDDEPAVTLNQTIVSGSVVWPHVEIFGVAGLNDLPESGASADKKVGAEGETARPGYRGGLTYTYTGLVRAKTMLELREFQADLRAAFADQTAEGRMDVEPRADSTNLDEGDARYFNATALGLEMADVPGSQGIWKATFTLALRNSAGTYFEVGS